MAEMKIKVDVTNTGLFNELLETISKLRDDDRVPMEVKKEIHEKVKDIFRRVRE